MIRVLHIVPTLGYGGVAQFILNYYRLMDKTLFVFDFITHGGEEDFHKNLTENASNIFYIKPISQSGIRSYISDLKDILSNHEYDIIHCHDGHITGITAMMCKRFFKGPIICHAHTALCANPKHKPFMFLFRALSRYYADALFACGKEAGKYLFGKNCDYKVIHNAVSVDRFQAIDKCEVLNLKQKLGIPTDSYVIGHVGAFCYQKNHTYLIKVFSEIRKYNSNVYMVLVGSGGLMDNIKRLCKQLGVYEYVKFVGKQSNIPLYMHLFDVFALPSHFEGLPVVAIEAQAAGLHCVLADAIDHEADIGLGLLDFIPTTSIHISQWAKALLGQKKENNKEKVLSLFRSSGYEIMSSVTSLMDEYSKITTNT